MIVVKYLSYGFYILISILIYSCVKPYYPHALQTPHNYLVVDGVINTAPNGVTTITLSRSQNLDVTTPYIPETGATVSILDSATGNSIPLIDSNNAAIYQSPALTLSQNDGYKLVITTANGKQYESAFVNPKTTPPIDSLTWEQNNLDNGVTIYVNTHDPSNSSHYYKWDFSETWQHNAPHLTYWVLINGTITPLNGTDVNIDPRQTYQCWTTMPTSHITVGNSLGLSQDVISRQPLDFIPFNDERLTVRYSILGKQYAISQDAYNYWVLIQNNSQNLGGLFDLTPSQLNSNIKCTNDPNEPVIGYLSACTTQQQRLFITNGQVAGWTKQEPYNDCMTQLINTDPNNYANYTYPDTSYVPWYFIGDNIPQLYITKKYCVDCRTQGGTNTKPSFW